MAPGQWPHTLLLGTWHLATALSLERDTTSHSRATSLCHREAQATKASGDCQQPRRLYPVWILCSGKNVGGSECPGHLKDEPSGRAGIGTDQLPGMCASNGCFLNRFMKLCIAGNHLVI